MPLAEGELAIFPNPSSGSGIIRLNNSISGMVELKLTDVTGKEVYSGPQQIDGFINEIPFDFSQFTAGTYFIQLKSASMNLTQKWIKK